MSERVRVSAPGKLILFGEHAVIYGNPCIVTAVDQRITLTAEKTSEPTIRITAPDVAIENFEIGINDLASLNIPKGAKFLTAAAKSFFASTDQLFGLNIQTKSDFSSKFGFGSSSATTVALIKALSELSGKKLSNQELFDLSYKAVLDVQGLGSGFDLAAAIWGGTIYFITGGKKISPLKINDLPLIIGYTGIKADTVSLVQQVARLQESHKPLVQGIFKLISDLVNQARVSIKQGNLETLGKLMNINQGLLESLGVGSKELSALIYAARESGAYGAKLSGAGGGDCMIAITPTRKKKAIESSIESAGGTVIYARVNAEGVRTDN